MPDAAASQTPRWPLVIEPENRDDSTSKDAKLVNCYFEQINKESYWVIKRPGTARYSQPAGAAKAGAGMFNWLGDIYAIFDNKLYKNGTAIAGTVDNTGGVYTFDQCLGGTPRLFFGNGVNAYTYDSGGGIYDVTGGDADFPRSFVKGSGYLDGTTYVGKAASGHIQGSDTNNPRSWDPLNDLVAQIEPDYNIALTKQLVYIVDLKQWSCEVFYDAGNATASPLGQVQGAKVNWGCVNSGSVQSIDGTILWVATNRSSAVNVMMLDNLKAEIISTKPVERLLDQADFTTVYSLQLKHNGHKFYVLTIKNSNLTLVFDLAERRWYQWTDASGNYFPFVASTYDSALVHYLQHETDGYIYTTDDNIYLDHQSLITVDLVTPNFDAGSRRSKTLNWMAFAADQVAGSVLQSRFSDDDYQTWSNFESLPLDVERPTLIEQGSFTRRAYNFRHQCNTPMRIQATDLQLDPGTA
jgi:hypothetical protein